MREIEQALFDRGITRIAGVDEAGRGPLAGPVVAAAAILEKDIVIPGLDDSKKLTEKKREKIYELLVNSGCVYSVKFVEAEIIDEIGIKAATHRAMELAVNEIASFVDIEHILIDGNDNFQFEIARMGMRDRETSRPPARRTLLTDFTVSEANHIKIANESIIKGDALCDCIAAASVLAKVSRDRYMLEKAAEFSVYGFEKHKGYGTAVHMAAIREFGLCPLHRRTFMTAKVLGV